MGSVAAVSETGSLVAASLSGSQLPSYAGGAARRIRVAGAQKVVPDVSTALRRVEEQCLPLESARAQQAYGIPSAINHLLVLNAEPTPAAAPSCCSTKPSDSDTTRRNYEHLPRIHANAGHWPIA